MISIDTMDVGAYHLLPDGLSGKEVAQLVDIFLREEGMDSRKDKYDKLDVIGDKQWHTYEKATPAVKDKVRQWVLSNWEDDDQFYAAAMGLCYNFGLEKALFERALRNYAGEQRWAYVEMLNASRGSAIDTYACFGGYEAKDPDAEP